MAQNHNAEYIEKPMTRDGRIQGPSRRYRRLRHPIFPAAEWTAKNPLLQRGEIGFEIDTHKAKVGDGVTYWNDLPYSFVAETEWGSITGDITDQTDLVDFVDGKVAAEAGLRADADDALQGQITANKDTMDGHIADTNNPHSVTASQVGLGNVDNTSDADKPISTATQDALDLKANIADLGTAAYTASTDYATAAQGTKADTALQPGDNVSELVNDAGYLTEHQTLTDLGITATASEINVLDGITASTTELNYVDGVTSNIQTQIDSKQAKSASAYNMGNTSGGWTAMSNTQQNALNSGANTTNIGQIATNTSNIANEIINRQNADNGLQSQIDAIVSKSDVVDIVGTYAELQAYDTSSLGNNDVVKVLDDSTHNDAPSFYRWVITGGVGAWVYVGSESETYTKAETDALLNAKQDNITATDGITLTGTTLTNSGVRAVASGTANGTISVNTNGTSADVSVTGLGSAAYTSSSDYATSAQGGKADTAVQPGDLATVATTGSYNDLLNKPTIPAAQVNSDWDAVSGVAQILNKPTLGTAAAADTTDFASALQGAKADTALQPGDNVSDLNNDAGYQTAGDVATAISGKQDTLTAGANITITGTTISATDTTYSDFTGASAGDAGTHGLVPAPAAGDQAKFLQGDGTWANPTAATAWGNITGTLSDQTDLQNALNAKQDTLTAGTNINITGTTISATDTTYTGSDGVTLTGTNFTNSGVRAVATGTTSGTVSVNTNGTSTDVAVNGWANKADDNAVVHLTGAETITGKKTFQNAGMTQEITSGSYLDFYQYIDGDRRGAIRTWKDSNDANHYYTIFGNCGPNAEAPKGLAVHRNASTIWTTAETPESGDNSSKIATTEWVHSAAPNLAMPSTTYTNLTLGSSGSGYTAPADGYFYVSKKSTAAGQNISFVAGGIQTVIYATAADQNLLLWVPATKGLTIAVWYNAAGTTNAFKFIYANGAA